MNRKFDCCWAMVNLAWAGPNLLHKPLFGEITGFDLAAALASILLLWALDALVMRWVNRSKRRNSTSEQPWLQKLLAALIGPARLALWVIGCYLALQPILQRMTGDQVSVIQLWVRRGFDWGLFLALLWGFLRTTRLLQPRFVTRTEQTRNRWDDVLVPVAFRAVQVMAPLLAVILAAPLLGLPLAYEGVLRKVITLVIIAAVAWVLIQAVLIAERAIVDALAANEKDQVRVRSISTQVSLLKRILVALISVFAMGCVLMSFDEVRRVGTSVLASAGLAGIVLGFAAQRVLANLFAGIQIAFTQPIRLGDAVVVEGEWGNVEEITLTYVVVRVWDLRRLVLPISYFIERPFQNWTRTSPSVIGTVVLYVDYTCVAALEGLRAEAKRIIEQSDKWDRGSWSLQVTDASERTMQVRVVVSAADSGRGFDLRCEIREGLIRWLQDHRPESLPRLRAEVQELARTATSSRRQSTPESQANGDSCRPA